jgi:hypothetical protein
MKVVILHRIPFAKIRYDLAIDSQTNEITYICLAGGGCDLPSDAKKIVLANSQFDIFELTSEHENLLRSADRLIARSENDLLPASLLRECYHIEGDHYAAVLPMRDKLLMRTRSQAEGIMQPAFWTCDEFKQIQPKLGRYLLKPRLEASSVGIVVGTPAELLARFESVDSQSFFVEELVPGEIFHVDGFVSQGKIVVAVTSVYVGNCLNFTYGAPLGSAQTELDPVAVELAQRVLSALGHQNGSFHFEGILAGDGTYYFLEVGCRVGGAGVAETFELKTGVNLYQADLRFQLKGEVPLVTGGGQRLNYGWFVYPGHHYGSGMHVDFDELKWTENLVSHQCNSHFRQAAVGFTYSPDASPLSGVVCGMSEEARLTIERIFEETQIYEAA